MAQNYQLDPDTGLPVLVGPGGAGIPLPLSAEQMRQAGAELAPPPGVSAVAPPPAPDGRLAQNDFRVHLQDPNQVALAQLGNQGPKFIPVGAQPAGAAQFRQRLDGAPAMPAPPPKLEVGFGPAPGDKKAPVKLAEPKQDKGAGGAAAGSPDVDPLVLAAMRGGGGGPARMAVSSETRKFERPGDVDPTLAAKIHADQKDVDAATEARVADHAAGEQKFLAAQGAEQQARLDQVEADRIRRQATDSELQRLQNVRTQRENEAAALKAPQLEDYWKDKGMGAQIATAIAAVCGGWLQGYRGGSNPGIDQMNHNIETWISGQKEEYERARGRISDADNHYKQALDVYGSPAQAEADLRLRTYAVRDQMLVNAAQQIGTEDAMKNAQLAIQAGKLDREKAAAAAQQSAKVEVEQKLSMQGGGGGGGVLAGLKRGAEATEYLNKIYGNDPKAQADARSRQVRLSTGEIKYVPDASARKEVQGAIDGRTDIIGKLEQLAKMQENENLITDPVARAKYDSLAAAVKSQATVLAGQGAMSAGDEKNITNGIPDSGIHIKDAAAALRQTIAGQRSSLDSTIRGSVYDDPRATRPYAAPKADAPSAQDVEE